MKCSECDNDALSSEIQMCESCIGNCLKEAKRFFDKYKIVEVEGGYEFVRKCQNGGQKR